MKASVTCVMLPSTETAHTHFSENSSPDCAHLSEQCAASHALAHSPKRAHSRAGSSARYVAACAAAATGGERTGGGARARGGGARGAGGEGRP